MLERMWGKGNSPSLVEVQAGTFPLDVSVVISQKIRKQPSSRPSNTTFGYISKGCSIVTQGQVPAFIFNWTKTTKDHLHFMSVEKNKKKLLEKVMKLYSVGNVIYQ